MRAARLPAIDTPWPNAPANTDAWSKLTVTLKGSPNPMTDQPAYQVARIDNAHQRIDGLEGRVHRLELSDAASMERDKHIQKSLANIESNMSRVVWLIIAAIITAIGAFIVQGGLVIG